jgi:hypothetical protein
MIAVSKISTVKSLKRGHVLVGYNGSVTLKNFRQCMLETKPSFIYSFL